jgi:hypothetical protein
VTKDNITAIICDKFGELHNTILSLANSKTIDRVVLAGFVDTIPDLKHPKITIMYNYRPSYEGQNGRNNKIICCYNALSQVHTKYAFTVFSEILDVDKMVDDLENIYNSNKLYTSSINEKVPFSPALDMLGLTKRVKEFWQSPLDDAISEGVIDQNTYITLNYLKIYSTAAGDAYLNPERYLYESSPEKSRMLESSNKVMDKYFGVYRA